MAATAASTAEVTAPSMIELESARPNGQVLNDIGDKPNQPAEYNITIVYCLDEMANQN